MTAPLHFPSFSLDLDAELLETGGQALRLRPKTWAVLLHLARNPGRVVTKNELLDEVWEGSAVTEDLPRISVGELRSALGDKARSSTIIETVHGKGFRLLVSPSHPSSRPRLAVLPPTDWNEARGESNARDPFAHLLTLFDSGLANALADRHELDVAGTDSARRALRQHGDLEEQARSLNVDFVLRARRAGGPSDDRSASAAEAPVAPATVGLAPDAPLRAELIQIENATVLWRRDLDRSTSDLAALSEDMVEEVVEVLTGVGAATQSGARPRRERAKHSEAFNLYLRGWRLQNQFATDDWNKASECYKRAIELDPDYAPPWSGQASVALLLASTGNADSEQIYSFAEESARRALELDPDLPEGHCTLGTVELRKNWNFGEAERRFRTAIALRPSYSVAHHALHRLLLSLGRFEVARESAARAFELDPLSPALRANLGFAETVARRPEAALELLEETLDDDPSNALAILGKGVALRSLERWTESIACLVACRSSISGTLVPALLGQVHGLAGDAGEARAVLGDLRRGGAAVPRAHPALVHAGLGEADQAFELLDEALAGREESLLFLIDPAYDGLRHDARFRRLVRAVGLTERVAEV